MISTSNNPRYSLYIPTLYLHLTIPIIYRSSYIPILNIFQIGEMSLIMNPDAESTRSLPKWRKVPFLNFLKVIEDGLGVATALVGLRASSSVDSRATIQFVRGEQVCGLLAHQSISISASPHDAKMVNSVPFGAGKISAG
jgi:hypothetical protein